MLNKNAKMDVRYINEGISAIDIQGEINALAENVMMDAYARQVHAARGLFC